MSDAVNHLLNSVMCLRKRRIIECTSTSPLPIDLDRRRNKNIQRELSDFRAGIQPKVILCKGRPFQRLAPLMKHFFPEVTLFVVTERSRCQTTGDADAYSCIRASANDPVVEPFERFNDAVSAYDLDPAQLPHAVEFRYRLRQDYRQLNVNHPGQRRHVLRAVTEVEDKIESDIWLHDATFQQEDILKESVSLSVLTARQ